MKKRIKSIIKFTLLITTFLFLNTKVYAASFSISASSKSIIVGKSGTIRISGSDVTGKFNISTSNSSIVSITGNSNQWIENNSVSVGIKANKIGSATITVKPVSVANNNGVDVSLSSKSITIKVVAAPKPSTNSYLSSLGIEGYTLSPEFNKDILEYNVEVLPETENINVSASPADSSSSITGTGTVAVVDGENKIEVAVKAQNGNERKYIINTNVKELAPIEVKVGNNNFTIVRSKKNLEVPELYEETTIKIGEEEVPAFKSSKTKYTLVLLKDDKLNTDYYIYNEKDKTYTLYKQYNINGIVLNIIDNKEPNSNYKKTEIKLNKDEIDAYKTSENSKFALIYGMNVKTGKKDWYSYDTVDNTLQRYNNDEINVVNDINDKLIIATGLSSVLFIISIIIIMSILIKKKKNG